MTTTALPAGTPSSLEEELLPESSTDDAWWRQVGYENGRLAGATHEELAAIHGLVGDLYGYSSARWSGATHRDILELISAGEVTAEDLHSYSVARNGCSTHEECLQAVKAGHTLWAFGDARFAGAAAHQAMEVTKGIHVLSEPAATGPDWRMVVGAYRNPAIQSLDDGLRKEILYAIRALSSGWSGSAEDLAFVVRVVALDEIPHD